MTFCVVLLLFLLISCATFRNDAAEFTKPIHKLRGWCITKTHGAVGGSKVPFRILLQSPAFSTHRRKPWQIQFKCKATQEEVFAVYSTSASAIADLFGQVGWGRPTPHWPFNRLWLAARFIQFVPNEDGSPFSALVPPFRFSALFFLLLSFSQEKCAFFSQPLIFRLILMDLRGAREHLYGLSNSESVLLWTIKMIHWLDNGLAVLTYGWNVFDWWISLDLISHRLLA